MRTAIVVVISAACFSAGCSLMIANSGKNLDNVTTRDQARDELGRLIETGVTEGEAYDRFLFHGKVPAPWHERASMGMGWAMTGGMGELYWLPRELFKMGRGLVIGQEVEVRYGPDGTVIRFLVGGKPWYSELFRHTGQDDASSPAAD